MYEWMRSLKINLTESTPLSDMVRRIADHPKLVEHSSTPVYAELVHGLTRKLRRFLTDDDGETVLYGPCPADECLGQLSCYADAETAKCPKCGFSMPVGAVDAILAQVRQTAFQPSQVAGQLAGVLVAQEIQIRFDAMSDKHGRRVGDDIPPATVVAAEPRSFSGKRQ